MNPLENLGKAVRVQVKGRVLTAWLTDYDESSDSYWGFAVTTRELDVDFPPVEFLPLRGLRQYPYKERPDYAFQFVFPGEDEGGIRGIAATNASGIADETIAKELIDPVKVSKDDTAPLPEQTEQVFDERDTDRDGSVSKSERKAWKKEHPEESNG